MSAWLIPWWCVANVALGHVVWTNGSRWLRARRKRQMLTDAALRTERIAKLELQLGIGLSYGREWLMAKPIACADHMLMLARSGNGAVERTCWGCDVPYEPHHVYADWYQQTPDTRELTDRLCPACYASATLDAFGLEIQRG